MNEDNSVAWMLAYQAGENAAFEKLYERFSPRVYGYLKNKGLSPEACEEIFQEIFLKFHRSRGRYQSRFSVAAWLFTIARSVLIDFFRKQARQRRELATEADKMEALATKYLSSLSTTTHDTPEVQLHGLSPQDQEIIERHVTREETFQEIARALGLNPDQTRKRASRALKSLRKKMAGVP